VKESVRQKLELLALVATAGSLIAHGGDIPTCGLEGAESITVNVVGDCGAPGVITISHGDGQCALRVSGDEVGLPRSGDSNHGLDSSFQLTGEAANGEPLSCPVSPDYDEKGSYLVSCYVGTRSDTRKVCDAEFTQVSKTCDVAKCAALECPEGQVARSALGACCPSCVEAPKPVDPPVVDSPCAKAVCATSCPNGQELAWQSADACCPLCTEQSLACFEQRDAFAPVQVAELAEARACSQDQDCTFAQIWTRCGAGCPEPIAVAAISASQTRLQALADQACEECVPSQPSCTSGEFMPGRPACVAGACVGVPLP
jgi:hypothetical protein